MRSLRSRPAAMVRPLRPWPYQFLKTDSDYRFIAVELDTGHEDS